MVAIYLHICKRTERTWAHRPARPAACPHKLSIRQRSVEVCGAVESVRLRVKLCWGPNAETLSINCVLSVLHKVSHAHTHAHTQTAWFRCAERNAPFPALHRPPPPAPSLSASHARNRTASGETFMGRPIWYDDRTKCSLTLRHYSCDPGPFECEHTQRCHSLTLQNESF